MGALLDFLTNVNEILRIICTTEINLESFVLTSLPRFFWIRKNVKYTPYFWKKKKNNPTDWIIFLMYLKMCDKNWWVFNFQKVEFFYQFFRIFRLMNFLIARLIFFKCGVFYRVYNREIRIFLLFFTDLPSNQNLLKKYILFCCIFKYARKIIHSV